MTRTVPLPVTIARRIAWLQSIAAAAGCVFGLIVAGTSFVRDRVAQRHGHPNEFAGLGEAVGLYLAGTALVIALAIVIPVVRTREPRDTARVWLMVVEIVVAVGSGLALRDSQATSLEFVAVVVAGVIPAVTVAVLLGLPSARAWTAESGESLREVGQ